MLTNERMYQALVERDASFEGQFIAAVRTTGIFCRPTCTARKPLKENVEFFPTTKEAILHGYRPCKVCAPLNKPGETPAYVREILEQLSKDPFTRFKDGDLRARGIEPNMIRRWFKKNHGITFHAFQRMQRINTAFNKIRNGERVTSVAFESGYASLSGFAESFKSLTGMSPSDSKAAKLIHVARLETPIGPMFAGALEEGICLLEFTDRRMLETQFSQLGRLLNATIIQGYHGHFDELQRQLNEYFEGTRKEFTVPLVTPGSEFQQEVWKELQTIPYGSTRSYREQAQAIRRAQAVRAVANANGCNRISILIPCHRVIGEDGHLTGYGGGLWRKKWLLDLEKGKRMILIQVKGKNNP
ncbi:MAG TPA: methylated-DNA--[protein]-cysteine S-methyltransferase [Chitinophagaceae bacterium]|nr:methylated-DNA--[protein]-cysteine S-methyltransferase [Chitinophagaceae bacterium]